MKNFLITLLLILTPGVVKSQNGGACTYTLPGGTVVCYVSGNAGVGSQNACFAEAVALGALPTNCLTSPLTSCATWYATNGVACFWGGLGGCGGATGSCSIVLPIELVNFYGYDEGKNNRLYWTTASEINNDYFTIERSDDGDLWIIIGEIDGAGISTSSINYILIDNSHRNITNYYRLKQTDFDGSSKYSDIISINNSVDRKIVRTTNMLGQDVDENADGLIIQFYSDGTSSKIFKFS